MQPDPQLATVDAQISRGELDHAVKLLENMLETAPCSRDLLLRLVDVALARKCPSVAISYANRLLDLDQTDRVALFYKARAELAGGGVASALHLINELDRMLEHKTAPFLLLKANILAAGGEYQAATHALETALAVDPGYAPAYQSLDHVLHQRGDLEEARAVWKRLISRSPDSPAAWTSLAAVSSALGEPEEAQACLQRVTELEPRNPGAWHALGGMYAARWEYEKAKHCLEQAIALDPTQEACISLLGSILNEMGDTHGALAILNPPPSTRVSFGRRLSHALLLPQIYGSLDDLDRWRARYSGGLAAMHAALETSFPAPAEVFGLNQSNFLLAYQGRDDLFLQREYARLLRRLIGRTRPELLERGRTSSQGGARIRVAFVSSSFRGGTVGNYFRSWVEDLDRARFEPMVIYTGAMHDATTRAIAAAAEHFVIARGGSLDIAMTILELRPDILIYPEVGMHSTNYLLASMRLAPVQCAAWGHPVTTGSELIDYYFTCSEMEPPGSSSHYEEDLLYLPGLGTKYAMPRPAFQNISREAYSLPSDRPLYVCPQSLFKIHPDNDRLFLDILAADDRAVIVFFQSGFAQVTQSFADRIARAMAARGMPQRRQIKFLPQLTPVAFRSILASADAVLDTVHWSGGNTSLDAISAGAPIVTLPGTFMRGRQSKAMLEMLGVTELIASNSEEYVALALRLAADAGHQRTIRQRILASGGELFERAEPLRALMQHLERIHSSAR